MRILESPFLCLTFPGFLGQEFCQPENKDIAVSGKVLGVTIGFHTHVFPAV